MAKAMGGPRGAKAIDTTAWNKAVAALAPTYWWKLSERVFPFYGAPANDSADANTGVYSNTGGSSSVSGILGCPSIIAGSADTSLCWVPGGTPYIPTAKAEAVGPYTMVVGYRANAQWNDPPSASGPSGIGGYWVPGVSVNEGLSVSGGGILQGQHYLASGAVVSLAGSVSVNDYESHLVGLEWDGATLSLWQDGAAVASAAAASVLASLQNFIIGFFTADPFSLLQSFVAWHRPLSAGEMASLWSGFQGA